MLFMVEIGKKFWYYKKAVWLLCVIFDIHTYYGLFVYCFFAFLKGGEVNECMVNILFLIC